ncbi:MAG: hypothetical protein R6U44_01570 [Archaeoglobaceae archaeon]
METLQVMVLFVALIVIGVFVLLIGKTGGTSKARYEKRKYTGEKKDRFGAEAGGKVFCLHDWKKPKTSFLWSSNVIEYRYVCKKCGKVKIENKPRKGD